VVVVVMVVVVVAAAARAATEHSTLVPGYAYGMSYGSSCNWSSAEAPACLQQQRHQQQNKTYQRLFLSKC
jgi:hypothetical protein